MTLIAYLAISVLGNREDTGEDNSESSAGTESVAQGLAVLDDGGFVAPDAPIVSDYQLVLDGLTRNACSISEERIAGMAVASRRQLAEKGVLMTHLQVLTGTLRSTTDSDRSGGGNPIDRCAMGFTTFILEQT